MSVHVSGLRVTDRESATVRKNHVNGLNDDVHDTSNGSAESMSRPSKTEVRAVSTVVRGSVESIEVPQAERDDGQAVVDCRAHGSSREHEREYGTDLLPLQILEEHLATSGESDRVDGVGINGKIEGINLSVLIDGSDSISNQCHTSVDGLLSNIAAVADDNVEGLNDLSQRDVSAGLIGKGLSVKVELTNEEAMRIHRENTLEILVKSVVFNHEASSTEGRKSGPGIDPGNASRGHLNKTVTTSNIRRIHKDVDAVEESAKGILKGALKGINAHKRIGINYVGHSEHVVRDVEGESSMGPGISLNRSVRMNQLQRGNAGDSVGDSSGIHEGSGSSSLSPPELESRLLQRTHEGRAGSKGNTEGVPSEQKLAGHLIDSVGGHLEGGSGEIGSSKVLAISEESSGPGSFGGSLCNLAFSDIDGLIHAAHQLGAIIDVESVVGGIGVRDPLSSRDNHRLKAELEWIPVSILDGSHAGNSIVDATGGIVLSLKFKTAGQILLSIEQPLQFRLSSANTIIGFRHLRCGGGVELCVLGTGGCVGLGLETIVSFNHGQNQNPSLIRIRDPRKTFYSSFKVW